jgi:hypothetical protein
MTRKDIQEIVERKLQQKKLCSTEKQNGRLLNSPHGKHVITVVREDVT